MHTQHSPFAAASINTEYVLTCGATLSAGSYCDVPSGFCTSVHRRKWPLGIVLKLVQFRLLLSTLAVPALTMGWTLLDAHDVMRSIGIPIEGQGPYLRLTPARHHTDGFFAAVMERHK